MIIKLSAHITHQLKTAAYALPFCFIILDLFYYWFAVADRNLVFLYYHDMGPLVPDTSPFSFVTASRYWMSALVANGIVFILYFLYGFVRSRRNLNYSPPHWLHVFWFCAPVLIAGILFITMCFNHQLLPFVHALKVLLATLLGLALALYAAKAAQKSFLALVLLGVDSLALSMVNLTSTWLEKVNTMPAWRFDIVIKLYVFCAILLIISSVVSVLKKIKTRCTELFVFSLAIAYLFGAAFHHFFGTDGHFYISNSDNFFTRNVFLQLLIWSFTGIIAIIVTKLRNKLIDSE